MIIMTPKSSVQSYFLAPAATTTIIHDLYGDVCSIIASSGGIDPHLALKTRSRDKNNTKTPPGLFFLNYDINWLQQRSNLDLRELESEVQRTMYDDDNRD